MPYIMYTIICNIMYTEVCTAMYVHEMLAHWWLHVEAMQLVVSVACHVHSQEVHMHARLAARQPNLLVQLFNKAL